MPENGIKTEQLCRDIPLGLLVIIPKYIFLLDKKCKNTYNFNIVPCFQSHTSASRG